MEKDYRMVRLTDGTTIMGSIVVDKDFLRITNALELNTVKRSTEMGMKDDLTHKSKENYTLKHFQERINIYNEEEFDYEIHNINLKD